MNRYVRRFQWLTSGDAAQRRERAGTVVTVSVPIEDGSEGFERVTDPGR